MHHDLMNRPDNHEAKMARADLFKLAQYSFKLFKMISEQQELEGWVQAKITKAADYIASVYHYMEYEMKVNEYGDAVENADMYSESIRKVFQQKLVEAKEMAAKAKAKAEKADKALDEELKGGQKKLDADKDGKLEKSDFAKLRAGKKVKEEFDKEGDTKKTRTGELTKTKTGVVHKRTDYTDDEHGEAPSTVKQKSAAEKKADKANDIKLPKHKGNTWGMKGGEKFGKKMEEAAKPDFLDMDKDGDKKEPMKKAVADKKKMETAVAGVPQKSGVFPSRNAGTPAAAQSEPKKIKSAVYPSRNKTSESNDKCNHTPAGKKCPIHGLKECGGMYEASHQEKTTMKHVKNPTAGEKKAAKDIKPGVKGYADRVAMLKSAEKDGRLKEGSKNLKQQAAIAIAKKKAK